MRMARRDVNMPDFVEVVLVITLALWTVSVFWLLRRAATLIEINVVSWTSLSAFFTGFGSIVLIVIAIIVADIRKVLLIK